jgi:hypothetical protein
MFSKKNYVPMKKFQSVILLACSFFLFACSPYKKNKDTALVYGKTGPKFIKNVKEDLYLVYGYDYWFHDLKKKSTLNWNDKFMKSLNWGPSHKEFLFVGHTIIEPYCSTLGMLYKNATSTEMASDIAKRMRTEFEAENIFTKDTLIGSYYYTILTYNLQIEGLKVNASYREYFCNLNKNVLRVAFWTVDSFPWLAALKREGDENMANRSILDPAKQ